MQFVQKHVFCIKKKAWSCFYHPNPNLNLRIQIHTYLLGRVSNHSEHLRSNLALTSRSISSYISSLFRILYLILMFECCDTCMFTTRSNGVYWCINMLFVCMWCVCVCVCVCRCTVVWICLEDSSKRKEKSQRRQQTVLSMLTHWAGLQTSLKCMLNLTGKSNFWW